MSTLADLEPEVFEEVRFPDLVATRSSRGSIRFPIKQPQKAAEGGRIYVPGDPVNLIDWRAYARTDQLVLREQRNQASAKVRIHLDLRPSMEWPDQTVEDYLQDEVPLRKSALAAKIAMNIAYWHLREQDVVELVILDESAQGGGCVHRRAPIRSKNDVSMFYGEILPNRSWDHLMPTDTSVLRRQRPEVAYLVSDLLQAGDEAVALLQGAKAGLVIQTLSSLELDDGWLRKDKIYFEAAEKSEYQGDTLLSGAAYRGKLAAWLESVERSCAEGRVSRFLFSESTELSVYFALMNEFMDPRKRA